MRAHTNIISLAILAFLIAAPALAAEPRERDIVDCNNNGIDDAIDVSGETATFSFPGGPLQDTHVLTYFYGTVPDLGPILDLDVGLDITHEWTGYAFVTLRDPSQIVLDLIDRPGHPDVVIDGFGDQGLDVILDDDAPSGQSIETTTASGGVVTGRLSPYPDALDGFDGQASEGTWRLAVGYASPFFQGQLNGWSLIFTTTLPVSEDCQGDLIPDECQLVDNDCDGNGVPDECDPDCNGNDVADACDITGGTSTDCDGNGIPDECEPDCNANGVVDACDITGVTSLDCQPDGVPDECQVGIGPTEMLWDNGDPIDDLTLAADFGPQPADVLTADDIELPVGGIIES
ncbi:MAG: proprotein convertase P-domain-containing protein, partial [Phycisphaerales bacterium]